MTADPTHPPTLRSRLARFIGAGLSAGLVLAVIDATLLLTAGVIHVRPLVLSSAWCVVGAAAAVIIALVAPFVTSPRRVAIAGAIAFAPVALGVHLNLFDGAAASQLPALGLFKCVVAAAILGSGAFVATVAVRYRSSRATLAVCGVLLVAAATAAHLLIYPKQYPNAHDVLIAHAIAGSLLFGFAFPLSRSALVIPALLVVSAAVGGSDPLIRPIATRLPLASRWLPSLLPDGNAHPSRPPHVLPAWSDADLTRSLGMLRDGGMPTRPNVVFVTIDALRVDRVAAYGAPSRLTPRLDSVAAAGTVFMQCRAPATLTYWSIMSMFTGLRPDRIKLHPEPDALPILPRALEDVGYRTYGSFPSWAVFPDSADSARQGPTSLGFSTVEDRDVTDTERVALLAKWVRENGNNPFFAWVHLMAPHAPYRPRGGPIFGTSAARRYDAEILDADGDLGSLVDQLVTAGCSANTVFIVSADHGEEFGEHGAAFHGLTAYDFAAHVPLVIAGPGIPKSRFESHVSLTDLMPSVLHIAGAFPVAALDGRSWFVPSSIDNPDRAIFIEQRIPIHNVWLRAVIRGRHKVILDFNSKTHQLYDIAADPAESKDISGTGLPAESDLLGLAFAPPPPLEAMPDAELLNLERLKRVGEGGVDRWGSLLLSPRSRLRIRAVEALGALPDARGRATLRWFAEALGPATDSERLRALMLAVPERGDLEHADPRFRLAFVQYVAKDGPPLDPDALLEHLRKEDNRTIVYEILRGTSWAKRPPSEPELERYAATADESGMLAARILATLRVDPSGRAIPGKAVVDASMARPIAIGAVGVEVTVPPSTGEAGVLNWILFWSTEDISQAAVFVVSGGATLPSMVFRQNGVLGIALSQGPKPITLQVLGNKVRPVFSAALRAAPPVGR